MENKNIKEYLNKDTVVYKLKIGEDSMFFVLFNSNEVSGKRLFNFFKENIKRTLHLSKIDENTFTILELDELKIDGSDTNRHLIEEVYR